MPIGAALSKGEEAKRREEDATYPALVLEAGNNSRPVARRERAEEPGREGVGPERGNHFGRAEVFRPLAPPPATTEAARGGGTAKRPPREGSRCRERRARRTRARLTGR